MHTVFLRQLRDSTVASDCGKRKYERSSPWVHAPLTAEEASEGNLP